MNLEEDGNAGNVTDNIQELSSPVNHELTPPRPDSERTVERPINERSSSGHIEDMRTMLRPHAPIVDHSGLLSSRGRLRSERPADRISMAPPSSRLARKTVTGRDKDVKTKTISTCSIKGPVSVDSHGHHLLLRSELLELEYLKNAFKDVSLNPEKWNSLCAIVKAQFGNESVSEKDVSKAREISGVIPTSIDIFKTRKIKLFHLLLQISKELILESASAVVYDCHLPHVAVELFAALHKDGCVSGEDFRQVGMQLAEALTMVVTNVDANISALRTGPRGQTVSMWAHFGGCWSRKSLKYNGVFELAFALMQSLVEDWGSSKDIFEDAKEPIAKLKISDERYDDFTSNESEGMARIVFPGSNRKLLRRTSQTSTVRAPTRDEVFRLSQLTTCMLLLDAHFRHSGKDKIVENFLGMNNPYREAQYSNCTTNMSSKTGKMGSDVADVTGDGNLNVNAEVEDNNSIKTTDLLNNGTKDFLEKCRVEVKARRQKLLNKVKLEVHEVLNSQAPNCSVEDSFLIDPKVVFDYTVKALKLIRGVECGDAMIAMLQLLGSLTQDWDVAEVGVKQGLIPLVLSLPHLERGAVRSVNHHTIRMLVRTILRHSLEDDGTLLESMINEIMGLAVEFQVLRSSRSVKALIESTSLLAARNMSCYITALHSCVMASGRDRTSEVDFVNQKPLTREERESVVANRLNVQEVVMGLCELTDLDSTIVSESNKSTQRKGFTNSRAVTSRSFDVVIFALNSLAEIFELSSVAAFAFIKAPSPNPNISGSALDYFFQTLLPFGLNYDRAVKNSSAEDAFDAHEISKHVVFIFVALCSKGASAHVEAVDALARAVKIESEKCVASGGILKGAASCLAAGGTRARVLKTIIKSNVGNDLARCLTTLDVDGDLKAEVCATVLKTLTTIGEAATYLSRVNVDDDFIFRDPLNRDWMEIRLSE